MWEAIRACSSVREVAVCLPWFGGGTLPVYWYGILAAIGIFVGTFYGAKHVEAEDENPDIVWDGLLWILLAGLLGARLWYVITTEFANPGTFPLSDPLAILNPRSGGMNIFGGAVGGLIALIIYARVREIKGWVLADAALMGLLLGQAIGRFGNLINQELYGPPTNSNWFGIRITEGHRLAEFQSLPADTLFHPTMIYEAVWLLLVFAALYYLFRTYQVRWIPGMLTGAYLILAGFGRFILEAWRPDQPTAITLQSGAGVSFSRLIAMVYVIVGIIILLDRMGYLRIPFTERPITRRTREREFEEMLSRRRRQDHLEERERARAQRRAERERNQTEQAGEPTDP